VALHFETQEFEARRTQVLEEMARRRLDAMLLFAPESHYWLTGYDTFGYVFFQCLVLTRSGEFTLLTRSADLRQARHTSLIPTVVIWTDQLNAGPGTQLRDLLNDLGLLGMRVGIEYDTQGLTAPMAEPSIARCAISRPLRMLPTSCRPCAQSRARRSSNTCGGPASSPTARSKRG
jgi:Xaa-Pro dipeptidase